MDEGTRRSAGAPPRAWESKDPLVRKYAGYRPATPSVSSPGPPRPIESHAAAPVPDRGLRSRLFGPSEEPASDSFARPARGPHGIDPSWYVRRPWKSARTRILPLVFALGGAWIGLSLIFGTNGLVRLWELETREGNLEAELRTVSREHDELQWELREPAPLALERSAREKFDLQRPGEIVYRFPRVPAAPGSDSGSRAEAADSGAESLR